MECVYKKWEIYVTKQFDGRLRYNPINNSMVFVLIYMRCVSEDKKVLASRMMTSMCTRTKKLIHINYQMYRKVWLRNSYLEAILNTKSFFFLAKLWSFWKHELAASELFFQLELLLHPSFSDKQNYQNHHLFWFPFAGVHNAIINSCI